MATSLYFTTGQAAHQLSASQAQLRALCEAGTIQSESTPGGQFRIPASEIERLKRAGLPAMPRPLPQEAALAAANSRLRHRLRSSASNPSQEVLTAAENVSVTQNLLSKRRLDLELAGVEDQFEVREAAKAARKAESEQAERARAEEVAHVELIRLAEEYAAHRMHEGVPAEMRLAAIEAVRARLEPLRPIPTDQVTLEIIEAVLEVELGSWLRLGDMLAITAEIHIRPPWAIRRAPESVAAAVKAAAEAMAAVVEGDIHASLGQLRAAAAQALEGVVVDFRHEERCQECLASRSWLRLPEGTDNERAQARAAVAEGLRRLPATATDRELADARDAALAPFHAAVATKDGRS